MQTVGAFEYSTGDLLGHGAFALVFLGRRIKGHQPVAIKQITLKNVPGKLSNVRQKEIKILKDLRHPNIVQLYDYMETPTDVYLIMEYCNGGDMGDYLNAKKTLSEDSIRILGRHIAGALEVLVSHQIIHRDIKPQNLLLSYAATNGGGGSRRERSFREATIKLADFGFARHLSATDMAATLCGSPLYMAPEILLGRRYDNKADLWSVGTILFQCLSGTAPFLASNPHALRKKYERETLVPKIPSGTSHLLSQLLLSLLKKDPKERLSYNDFFGHSFLKDNPSVSLESSPHLSLHVKSSPVPIRRHAQRPPSRHSTSPRHGSSVEMYSLSPSSASGPPLSHQIGSQSSLPYYSAQSPKSDITDQGFILVDLPGSSGSRRFTRSNSVSISQSPGSYVSHTPSSAGSLTRYTSLTTPFYQVPANSSNSEGIPLSSGTTPTNVDTRQGGCILSSGYHSRTHIGSLTSLSRSNSGRRNSAPTPAHAPHVPFGQLIQYVAQQPNPSPMSNVSLSPHSHSPHPHSLSKSNTPSPMSTPPSSLPSAATQRGNTGNMRYASASHGSGTKLSALAEEREIEREKERIGRQRHSQSTKRGGQRKTVCEDFITQSCLLNSDDEGDSCHGEERDVEESFLPLSLTMSFNSSQSTDDQEVPEINTEHAQYRDTSERAQCRDSSNKLAFVGQDKVKFTVSGEANIQRESGVRRASSFSHRNPRLSQELAAIRTKATNLSYHDNSLDQVTPTEKHTYIFDSSRSPEIVQFQMPFLFPLQNSNNTAASPGGYRQRHSQPTPRRSSRSSLPSADSEPRRTNQRKSPLANDEDRVNRGCPCLCELKQNLLLGKELLAMAQARQGPIMLLSTSTSLNDSGIGSRVQRFSEQLVLYAKAIALLKSSLLEYELIMASKSMEPSQSHKKVESDVHTLLKVCLEKVKSVREQLSECVRDNDLNQVSAEKLLYLEALDMCKAAVLDEKSGEAKECIKRYRRAKLIFQYLLANAHTHHDKALLQKYVHTSQTRVEHLLSRVT